MPLRNILVFGATSAIAQEALRVFVQRGASVYCVGRSPDRLAAVIDDLRVRANSGQIVEGQVADLLDTTRHPALFKAARAALGEVDAVLVAHGTLPGRDGKRRLSQETAEPLKREAVGMPGFFCWEKQGLW